MISAGYALVLPYSAQGAQWQSHGAAWCGLPASWAQGAAAHLALPRLCPQYVDWSPTVPNRTQPLPAEDAITGDPVPKSSAEPEVRVCSQAHLAAHSLPSCVATCQTC
jgi:hypothetical protein